VGSPGFYVLDSVLKPIAGIELPKEVFTSRVRWMPLIVEWNASANIFYLLKNLLLLILVIFKLKCNNLIVNEIRVLIASYVCLHAFSLCQESPDPDPRRWTPHFWGGSVTTTSEKVATQEEMKEILQHDSITGQDMGADYSGTLCMSHCTQEAQAHEDMADSLDKMSNGESDHQDVKGTSMGEEWGMAQSNNNNRKARKKTQMTGTRWSLRLKSHGACQ
jgi:hypothetical protein